MTTQDPPFRFIRLPEVLNKIGISRSKLYVLIENGEFMKPTKIGITSVWLEQEVDDWMRSKMKR